MKTQLKIHFQMSETCVKIQPKPVNQKNLVEVNRKVTQTKKENFVHKNNLAVAWENKS